MTFVNVPPPVKMLSRSFQRMSEWASLTTSCSESPSLLSSFHVSRKPISVQVQLEGSVAFFGPLLLGIRAKHAASEHTTGTLTKQSLHVDMHLIMHRTALPADI